MRDELEALLEEEEAWEAELAAILSTRVVTYRSGGRGTSAAEENSRPAAGGSEGSLLQKEQSVAVGPEEYAGMTLAQRLPAAESLYAGLAKARQAARYKRPDAGSRKIQLEKETAGNRRETVDAARLDRLFQRDARRYDGGFTWQ